MEYIKETIVTDVDDYEKSSQLIESILKAQNDLSKAHINFEFAEDDLIDLFKKGIKLLQNDYLGGNGSRGYGQIEFGELKRTDYCPKNNWNGETKESIQLY